MVAKGVTELTAESYGRSWDKWQEFVGSVEEGWRPDAMLVDVEDATDKAKWLAIFVGYLVEVKGFRGEEKVGQVLSGLRYRWKSRGMNSEFFDATLVKSAKQGARRTTDELKVFQDGAAEKRMLPAFVEMVLEIRRLCMVPTGSEAKDLMGLALWCAAAVAFDMGLRPCSVTQADGPTAEKHCLRAKDFTFVVQGEGGGVMRIRGGPGISEYLRRDPANRAKVLQVEVVVVTGKTQNRASFVRDVKVIGRGNHWESLILDDLLELFSRSGALEDDEFTVRYARQEKGKRRGELIRAVVTAKSLRNIIKLACGAFNLPAANFSGKSLRKGFASHAVSCGADPAVYKVRAGWSVKARTAEDHYVSSYVRGTWSAAVSDSGELRGLGAEGVRGLLPV
jgi:hypothetical protein